MEKSPPELNNQNNPSNSNEKENEIPPNKTPEENTNLPQNLPINSQVDSSEINNNQIPPSNIQSQIPNLIQNIQNIPQPEINPSQISEHTQEIPNISQMANINHMSLQDVQMAQQQINDQYMLHYQNQISQMPNNQELPMNGYMYNYPQIIEQNQFQQQQNQPMDYQENKNIYDYATNMNLYGIAFQNGNCRRLAISSLEKRFDNKIEILELIDKLADNDLKKECELYIGYPCTKLLWSPNKSKNSLLAFSSDCIQIYDYSEEKQNLVFQTKLNNVKSKYNGPLTSFDWNTANDALLGTASVDTTCTIWDLNKLSIKTQLIAHDKEVFDIQFGKEENIFISGGADGSVRLFDLRNLDHSTIIYETKGNSAINKLAWNLQTSNLIAALSLDKNIIYIFDSRMNTNVSLDELNLHKEPVTGFIWAPDNPSQLCSVSEDCNVIISNVNTESSQNNNVSYTAPYPINNVDWCKVFPEWIGITFKNRVQLLMK